MKSERTVQFSRRTLLKAAGTTLFVPHFLQQAFAQTAPVRPNLVLLMQTNGVNQSTFWPAAGTWTSPQLAKLLEDPAVGSKATLVRGVNLKKMGNPGGNGHDWGFHGLYSGYDNVANGSDQFGGGPSLDQTLIKRLDFENPYPALHCGVHAADYRIINAGRASFSCASAGQQLPCEINIYSLYSKVFGSLMGPSTDPEVAAAAARRLAQRKSVLDAVASDLTALEGRLGAAERAKVDAHLTSLQEFERRLSNASMPDGGGTGLDCSALMPSRTGVPTGGQGNEANADALNRLFMEFIANTVACNMVGVLTFQFGRGGEHFHYGWLNIPGMRPDFHDEIAHKDTGSDAVAASVMVEVGKYYTELVTDLATRLNSFPQADGKTALDNSLVVWGNEIATGPHGTNGYPIVLLGGAAGRLARTGYVVSSGDQPHHRLGCTLHNIMGDAAAGFGADPSCGVLRGLELTS
jgi:hypothetical protein